MRLYGHQLDMGRTSLLWTEHLCTAALNIIITPAYYCDFVSNVQLKYYVVSRILEC